MCSGRRGFPTRPTGLGTLREGTRRVLSSRAGLLSDDGGGTSWETGIRRRRHLFAVSEHRLRSRVGRGGWIRCQGCQQLQWRETGERIGLRAVRGGLDLSGLSIALAWGGSGGGGLHLTASFGIRQTGLGFELAHSLFLFPHWALRGGNQVGGAATAQTHFWSGAL